MGGTQKGNKEGKENCEEEKSKNIWFPSTPSAGKLGAKATAALAEKMAKEKAAEDLQNRTQKLFKTNEEVSDIRFSPDDHLLAVASRDNWIYIYDVKNE